ncbi:MAG: SPOR domain-containing protein [Rhodocyclales bacterium]|nr:SPOR domain-containing protein [Rhodocyclales bacterium]
MPLLRLLLIILVLFNLLALAAGQGWLGTSETRGEPERLTNQINPDAIILKAARPEPARASPAALEPEPEAKPTPAALIPAPVPAPNSGVPDKPELRAEATPAPPPELARDPTPDIPVCYAYTLPQPQADELEKLFRAASRSINVSRETVEPANTWWVRIPPFDSRQRAEKRMRELKELGLTDLFVVREPGPNQNAISLGLFRTESSARQHLADLTSKRVRDADVIPRNPAIQRLEVRGNDAIVKPASERIGADRPILNRSACPSL